MHLSTSSSNNAAAGCHAVSDGRYRSWLVVTAICLVLLCFSLEMVTRVTFRHISRIESRIANQYGAARNIRRMPLQQSVLFVGNSLPLEGINIPQLQKALGARVACVPFFVEQTQYLDWYFGMRRLFREGGRPDVVVLSMNIPHVLSSTIRGDYSAFYLFQISDLAEIRRDADLNLTATSGLLLAHYSLFYAGRTPLRNFLLNKIDPSYGAFLHDLSIRPVAYVDPSTTDKQLTKRLWQLRRLSESYGIRFIFLLPPGFGSNESSLLSSAKTAGVTAIVPIHLNTFGLDKFRDGFHLNATGSEIFTGELVRELERYLDGTPGVMMASGATNSR